MRVYVIGIESAAALNTVSVLDGLTKSDAAWRALHDPTAPDMFEPVAIGLRQRAIEFAGGVRLTPGAVVPGAPTPDLVIVPGLDDDVQKSLEENRPWVPWIRQWHDDGAILASSCTGAFLLAEAGVLDGRQATTHWATERLFRAAYPSVDLVIDRVVVDEGDVITSGGATTVFNLVHYVVYRFGSPERARAATRMMLLDSARESQLPFATIGLDRQHTDRLVHDAQSAIQQGRVEPLTVAGVAALVGASARTLHRRFLSAIGKSPQAYLHEVRVESAKRLLEQTSRSIDDIRREVGFLDSTAFRRAFKSAVGVTPTEYRRRFTASALRGAADRLPAE